MIKRTLGLWADEGGAGGRNVSDSDDDDSDPDPGLTTRQRRRLERRFVPGAVEGVGRPASKRLGGHGNENDDAPSSPSDYDSDDDSRSSDDEPVMPPEQPKQIRGEYRCELCANKILLNSKALEQHLQSEGHKKNERRFQHAKEIGLEAYQAECMAKLKAKEAAEGQQSKKKLKNSEYWEKRRAKSKISSENKAKDLTTAEIERQKLHFQEKKKRRFARKAGLVEESVPTVDTVKSGAQKRQSSDTTNVIQAPKRLNRKERRKQLQRT